MCHCRLYINANNKLLLLHKELSMSKVFAQWVPWLLTPDEKHIRMVMSKFSNILKPVETQDFSNTKEGEGGGLSREGVCCSILACKGHFDD